MERKTFVKILVAFLGIYILFEAGVFLISTSEVVWSRVTLSTIFFVMLAAGVLNRLRGKQTWEKAWCELADRTGLTCRTTGFWFGYPVHVIGTYRGYGLTLYLNHRGRLQAPTTRIEVDLKNRAKNHLRLGGPYQADEAGVENMIGNFFGAKGYQLGNRQFFAKSQPKNLAANLFALTSPKQKALQEKLLKLEHYVNIEIEGSKLYFDQIGVLEDADYLHYLFDLLSDLADAFERVSQWVKP